MASQRFSSWPSYCLERYGYTFCNWSTVQFNRMSKYTVSAAFILKAWLLVLKRLYGPLKCTKSVLNFGGLWSTEVHDTRSRLYSVYIASNTYRMIVIYRGYNYSLFHVEYWIYFPSETGFFLYFHDREARVKIFKTSCLTRFGDVKMFAFICVGYHPWDNFYMPLR